ncbi:hypothetical protein CLOP_g23902 [Closterium sp. NIES-67]|nr:hypothetical protein CLOP_g23902 [Closterium sp. NIES-67]
MGGSRLKSQGRISPSPLLSTPVQIPGATREDASGTSEMRRAATPLGSANPAGQRTPSGPPSRWGGRSLGETTR